MPVRVAIVCPISGGGGITEAFFNSLEMLAQQGQTAIAIVPSDFTYKERLTEIGVEQHFISGLGRGGHLNVILQAFRLQQAIARVRPDILLLNNGRHVAAAKMMLPNLPIVAIFHGGKPKRFKRADRVIAINDDQVSSLIHLGYPRQKTAIVDNALPEGALPPYQAGPKPHSTYVVGTMRLLDPAKGIEVLIEAVAILKQRGIVTELRIAGTGPARQHLEERVQTFGIKAHVHFVGWVEDQLSFYRQLDLFILPSHSEEWGLVIVEAQAAGLPVIATSTRGPRRIIEDGVTGLLVPIADPHAMADAIEKLITEPEMAEQLARSGYDKCADNYLLPKVATLFTEEVLKTLKVSAGEEGSLPTKNSTDR